MFQPQQVHLSPDRTVKATKMHTVTLANARQAATFKSKLSMVGRLAALLAAAPQQADASAVFSAGEVEASMGGRKRGEWCSATVGCICVQECEYVTSCTTCSQWSGEHAALFNTVVAGLWQDQGTDKQEMSSADNARHNSAHHLPTTYCNRAASGGGEASAPKRRAPPKPRAPNNTTLEAGWSTQLPAGAGPWMSKSIKRWKLQAPYQTTCGEEYVTHHTSACSCIWPPQLSRHGNGCAYSDTLHCTAQQ